MADWINRNDKEPSKDLRYILVWGDRCNKPHVGYYDCDEWCFIEFCYKEGHHFIGCSIHFTYWMECPKGPKKEE